MSSFSPRRCLAVVSVILGAALAVPAMASPPQLAIVLNSDEGSLSVVDRQTMKEVDKRPIGREPHHLMLTPDGKELIFYCDRAGEATSLKIAMWAFDNGRSRVGVLVGGWAAWEDAGYPVEPKTG